MLLKFIMSIAEFIKLRRFIWGIRLSYGLVGLGLASRLGGDRVISQAFHSMVSPQGFCPNNGTLAIVIAGRELKKVENWLIAAGVIGRVAIRWRSGRSAQFLKRRCQELLNPKLEK